MVSAYSCYGGASVPFLRGETVTITVWTDSAIKLAIATFASTWAVFLRKWLDRSSQIKSESKSPKNVLQKIGGKLTRLLMSTWFTPLFSIGFGIYDLWRDSRGAPAVTPRLVIELALDVGLITYGTIMYIVLVIWQAVRENEELRRDIISLLQQHNSVLESSFEMQQTQNRALKSLLLNGPEQ